MTAKKEWPVKELEISKLRIDGGTQMRAKIDQDTVNEYRDLWKAETEFPPLVVYWDGTDLWLAGGFHRYHGAKAAGLEKVKCEVRDGTLMDAILFAVGDNRDHGLKRTNADKHKAVHFLLTHPEWSKKSDRAIADAAGVSHSFVQDLRKQLTEQQVAADATSKQPKTRTGKDGKEHPIKKKPKAPKEPESEPDAIEPADVLDQEDNAIPEHLIDEAQDCWNQESVAMLNALIKQVHSKINSNRWMLASKIMEGLTLARNHILNADFYCLCPTCKGAEKGCGDCRKHGWVPQWRMEEMENSFA